MQVQTYLFEFPQNLLKFAAFSNGSRSAIDHWPGITGTGTPANVLVLLGSMWEASELQLMLWLRATDDRECS